MVVSNSSPSRRAHDRHAVIADGAADNDDVARLRVLRRDVDAFGDDADAAGIDKDAVAVSFLDDFGIARHQRDSGVPRRETHALDDAPQAA